MSPSVAAEPPAGWLTAELARPPFASGSTAAVTQWTAWRAPAGGGEALLLACVATPVPGWVEDMRPAVEARVKGLAGASADRLAGGDAAAHTRTFVGWTAGDVVTCFATCAAPKATAHGARACDASVDAARFEGSAAPPSPGLALGALTWAVHHPATTVLWGGVFVFLLAVVAVLTRRRPRSRI